MPDTTGTARTVRLPVARSGLPWAGLALLAILVDQLTKLWVVSALQLHEAHEWLPVLSILRAHNTGAAFSFLAGAGGWQRWLFTALALVVSFAILTWLRRLDGGQQRLLVISLALILGGALGNVIDRLRHGYVVDFVAVHWQEHYFPAFNVADSCITVGAGLLLLDALLDSRRRHKDR
ncbi:MAG TPA: signal peptidase II [Steroidobacteraceae bacterium]|jgi:signal peptidase II|nr:signal peptidase II [Steroidobacteraceae bacterium]